MASYGKRKISNMHDWFFDGYKAVQVVEDGKKRIKYEYHGFLYGFRKDAEGVKRLRLTYALITALYLAAYLVGVLQTSSLANNSLAGGVFLVCGVALFYFLAGLVNFLLLKLPPAEFNHRALHRSFVRLQWGSRFLMGGSALAVILAIVFAASDAKYPMRDYSFGGNIVFLVCALVAFACSLALMRLVSDVENGYVVTKEKERGIDD